MQLISTSAKKPCAISWLKLMLQKLIKGTLTNDSRVFGNWNVRFVSSTSKLQISDEIFLPSKSYTQERMSWYKC